ncbi:MAG TPA: VOC family protein [Turneriella sp.]|nr:VOC family protein [Turneriella sp.]
MRFTGSAINLPVQNITRTYNFYKQVFSEATVALEENIVSLRIGASLYFFMEHEAFETVLKPTQKTPEFTTEKFTALLSATVTTRDDAYAVLKRATDAGGTSCGQAVHYAWGAAAYFEDVDHHLWEIIYRGSGI